DMNARQQVIDNLTRLAKLTAQASGQEAEVKIRQGYPVTVNHPELVDAMLPVTREIAGQDKVVEAPLRTASEDFSFYAQEVPGMFVMIGATPADQDPAK